MCWVTWVVKIANLPFLITLIHNFPVENQKFCQSVFFGGVILYFHTIKRMAKMTLKRIKTKSVDRL